MPFWSVVQTESQRENVAASFLQQAEFEIYLPKILVRHGVRERVAPLFPGYLFIEIIERWWSVRWTAGVVRLLMVDDRPARVPDVMMDAIKKREGRDGLVKLPKPRGLVCGDQVRILRGNFEGRLGVYQGQSGAQRSRILLDLLGREVLTAISTRDVERVVG
jgi:transcriptional antiterminator RfaH